MGNNQECTRNIKESLRLARELIILADEGERYSRDDGCVLLFGVVRDCAYKIRKQAEAEMDSHRTAGRWKE